MSFKILGGTFRSRTLQSPSSSKTRPTQGIVRQAVFNICQQQIEGALFLDLFAGSGAMGLEAISRGAAHATLIEQDLGAVRCIRANVALLKVEEKVTLWARPVLPCLAQLVGSMHPFDLIYMDPPYRAKGSHQEQLLILEWLDTKRLIAPGGVLFVERAVQSEELVYSSSSLLQKETRRFGIAHLYRFQRMR